MIQNIDNRRFRPRHAGGSKRARGEIDFVARESRADRVEQRISFRSVTCAWLRTCSSLPRPLDGRYQRVHTSGSDGEKRAFTDLTDNDNDDDDDDDNSDDDDDDDDDNNDGNDDDDDDDDDDDNDESAWCVSALRAVRRRRMLAARRSLSHWPRVTRKRELRTMYLSLFLSLSSSLFLSLSSLDDAVRTLSRSRQLRPTPVHDLFPSADRCVAGTLLATVVAGILEGGKQTGETTPPGPSGHTLDSVWISCVLTSRLSAVLQRRTLNASLELPWRHPSLPPHRPLLTLLPSQSTWSSSFVNATPHRASRCASSLPPSLPYFSL